MPDFSRATVSTTVARGVTRTPGVYHGEAVLADTRFPTAFIGMNVLDYGYTEAQLRTFWPWLTERQIRAGLAYERRLRRERKKRKRKRL